MSDTCVLAFLQSSVKTLFTQEWSLAHFCVQNAIWCHWQSTSHLLKGRYMLSCLDIRLVMGYITKMYAWRGRDVAQLVEYGVQHAADTDLTPWCSMGFFCQSRLSVQTLFRCLNSPHVQSHALTSVHRLKILSLGSHTIIWTQKNTAHTLGHPSKMESGSPNGKRTVVSLHVGFH